MSFCAELRLPAEHAMLVAIYEANWLNHHAEKAGALGVLSVMTGYFAMTSPIVKPAARLRADRSAARWRQKHAEP